MPVKFARNARAVLLSASILAAPAVFDAPAAAQTAPAASAATAQAAGGLEDIVVTAQRRKESVQTVPIAVSAFSAASLEAKNITDTNKLIQYVPNLFGSNNTGLGSANAYYIRGLGNTESIATFDPPVGTYVDDIYLSRQNANNFGFFDLERIEVLRGPQGTLFGRNTTGGAVNVIMKQPGDTLGGFLEAGYGSYQKKEVRGSIDLPLNASFGLKVSGYYQDDNGYVHDTTTGQRLNSQPGAGIRVAAKMKITDALTWNGAYTYTRNAGTNLLNYVCDPNSPTHCNGRFASTGLRTDAHNYGVTISGEKANFPLGNVADQTIFASNFQYDFGGATLNIITGVVNLHQRFALDFSDGRALPSLSNPTPAVRGFTPGGFDIINDGKSHQFTQEIKLNGKAFGGFMDYVIGGYYYDETDKTDFADVFNLGPAFGIPGPIGFPFLLGDRYLTNTAKAKAVYGQFDFHVTEQLKLTAGVRYTDETKTFAIRDNRASCAAGMPNFGTASCLYTANLIASNGVAIPTSQSKRLWTPRFVANYQATRDVLLFASATKGFKSGGWNARGYTANTLLPFGPEETWSYELGLKSEWFDRKLRVNLTAFYQNTAGLQTPSAFVATDGTVSFITQNFATYHNRGLELEIEAQPVENLNVFFNAGYQKDNYIVDRGAPTFNQYNVKSVNQQQIDCLAELAAGKTPLGATGNVAADCAVGIVTASGGIARPVRTPRVSIAAGGSYDFKFPEGGFILTPSANIIYRSSFETGTANASIYTGAYTSGAFTYPANPFGGTQITGSRNDGYVLVNASLALRTDDKNWTVSIECNNCFDKTYLESNLANTVYLNAPRTWLVRAKRVF